MSYASALTDNKDRVRLLIGDTNTDDELLTDGEINYLTGLSGNVFAMAAEAAESIAAKFSRYASEKVGPLSYEFQQRAEQYALRAAELRRRAQSLVLPVAGGITITDKDAQEDDTDRVSPGAARGQFADTEAVQDSRFSNWSGLED